MAARVLIALRQAVGEVDLQDLHVYGGLALIGLGVGWMTSAAVGAVVVGCGLVLIGLKG